MDNRLGGNNTQQRLIGGQTAPQSAPRRESGDVFVANVGEKRYLWTARAFAIITAISLYYPQKLQNHLIPVHSAIS